MPFNERMTTISLVGSFSCERVLAVEGLRAGNLVLCIASYTDAGGLRTGTDARAHITVARNTKGHHCCNCNVAFFWSRRVGLCMVEDEQMARD